MKRCSVADAARELIRKFEMTAISTLEPVQDRHFKNETVELDDTVDEMYRALVLLICLTFRDGTPTRPFFISNPKACEITPCKPTLFERF
jgi:hypothetical protein